MREDDNIFGHLEQITSEDLGVQEINELLLSLLDLASQTNELYGDDLRDALDLLVNREGIHQSTLRLIIDASGILKEPETIAYYGFGFLSALVNQEDLSEEDSMRLSDLLVSISNDFESWPVRWIYKDLENDFESLKQVYEDLLIRLKETKHYSLLEKSLDLLIKQYESCPVWTEEDEILLKTASNRNTPIDVLRNLSKNEREIIRRAAIQNPTLQQM